jgi:hypothetical protein
MIPRIPYDSPPLTQKYETAILPHHIAVPSLPDYAFFSPLPLDREFDTQDVTRIMNILPLRARVFDMLRCQMPHDTVDAHTVNEVPPNGRADWRTGDERSSDPEAFGQSYLRLAADMDDALSS